MSRRIHDFQSIRPEGGLLPPDLLRRVLDPREKLAGTLPEAPESLDLARDREVLERALEGSVVEGLHAPL